MKVMGIILLMNSLTSSFLCYPTPLGKENFRKNQVENHTRNTQRHGLSLASDVHLMKKSWGFLNDLLIAAKELQGIGQERAGFRFRFGRGISQKLPRWTGNKRSKTLC